MPASSDHPWPREIKNAGELFFLLGTFDRWVIRTKYTTRTKKKKKKAGAAICQSASLKQMRKSETEQKFLLDRLEKRNKLIIGIPVGECRSATCVIDND